ncbi:MULTISPECIES: SDR family oxidoreductase [Curtobacterium]|jgi:nucleoside-diphosphate-sugar epimerase|uniref:SDR family oxidoreductase n=1 Tax=Curtobacterium TaxID=2034 RepID=UPI000DA7B9CE|nr:MULTISPECIES: SDR family oxidoreductase [Curtobacterium]MBT1606834.1 SDR family oxidoreductase [Curtobacterium flaccumfaciens pv. betae]MBT1657914.1 SDR family oxidoreductase [Curtobacterium flaccumfaciens pv. betae]MBT1669872.1 SDR family oxidoreductase [Curtobacterium flaccumfaciens pv. flaccumfaciens]MCS0471801.1 SDR family oxidoreductase [Curtobacterium flaccumfaciens pv. betae]MCS0475167.1 SDR family oxidoreductase [Curtobacterium flaccumfaciens pv. betae]
MTATGSTEPTPARREALVVGASGITGSALVRHLLDLGWDVTALSRRPLAEQGVRTVAADLRDPESLTAALADEHPTHVFFTAWQRQDTEAENIRVNGGMVRDLLAALSHAPLEHVALVTGLKHYLGPFEAYAAGEMPDTPFHEEEPRLDTPNFYYAQEDELFAAAERQGFTWSVHRSHTVIGHAVGNAMNMGLTLAVQATLAKELDLDFVFPGSEAQWNGLTDMTDAGILAEHMVWASTSPEGADEPFNIVNGDVFRWRWMWPRLAAHLGVDPARVVGYEDAPRPLEEQMAPYESEWAGIAERHGLAEADITRLASWWHTDADLGRAMEVVTDMGKSRDAGFTAFRRTEQAFADLFARYRADRLIP